MAEMMTAADIHDFGVEVVFGFLQRDGWEIVSVNTKVGIDPQIVAKKGGQLGFIVVRTDVYPCKGSLATPARKAMAAHAARHEALAYFASVGIANSSGKSEAEMSVPEKGAGFYVAYKGLEELSSLH